MKKLHAFFWGILCLALAALGLSVLLFVFQLFIVFPVQDKFTYNETANWKTYTNDEHNFEIKYPNELKPIENNLNHGGLALEFSKASSELIMNTRLSIIEDVFYSQNLERNMTIGEKVDSAEEWLKRNWNAEIERTNIIFNNKPAVKVSYKSKELQGFEIYLNPDENYPNQIFGILVSVEDKDENIYMPIFNQMLSTFKFTK